MSLYINVSLLSRDEYVEIIAVLYDHPLIFNLSISICIGVLFTVLITIKCMRSDETPEDKED